MHRHRLFAVALACCIATGSLSFATAPSPAKAVKVGIVPSAFQGIPKGWVPLILEPFNVLIKEQSGVDAKLTLGDGIYDLGKRLNDGDHQLVVFQGFEFAWARDAYPKLRPLVIAVNGSHHLRAKLVTRADTSFTKMSELRGKELAVPQRCKGHCQLFLKRHCSICGEAHPEEFCTMAVSGSNEEALDNVILGTASAALVDGVDLENYAELKPGCFRRLKVIHESEVFPAAVVAYREGGMDESVLARFRAGMLASDQSVRGRQLLSMVQVRGFAAIPDDYEETMTNMLRHYPAPGRD